MNIPIPDNLESLSDAALASLIRETAAEEKRLSLRRRKLQDRLDFLRAGGGGDTAASGSLLEKLVTDEESVSTERKDLHHVIDRLAGERARRLR